MANHWIACRVTMQKQHF